MVNPGAFQGSRKTFLISQKPAYVAGVEGHYTKDALALIHRRYLKRYPIDLPHEEEPSQDVLSAVDDDSAEDEQEEPSEDSLTPEEYQDAVARHQNRVLLLKQRKGQISRWMAYQYMKDHDTDPKESGTKNPYTVMLHNLTGVSVSRPRFQTAANLWRRTNRAAIEEETVKRALQQSVNKKKMAPVREKVVKEWFKNLDAEAKKDWEHVANTEHEEALEKHKRELKEPPSQEPQQRQRCIQNITHVAQPFLDMLCEATGWKATLIIGGPEPADGGQLNCVAIHSGTTTGDIKMNFGRAEQLAWSDHIFPTFCSFLRKSYSPEECRARAMSAEHEGERIAHLELSNAELHRGTTLRNSDGSIPAPPSPPVDNSTNTAAISPRNPQGSLPPSRNVTPPLDLSHPSPCPPSPRPPSPYPSPRLPIHALPNSPGSHPPLSPPRKTVPAKSTKRKVPAGHETEDTRRSKRIRDGDISSPSNPPSQPTGPPPRTRRSIEALASSGLVPKWFTGCLQLFESVDFGLEWTGLLDAWGKFEAENEYVEDGRLGAQKRPKLISNWVKSARPTSWNPIIQDVEKFEAEMMVWWAALQPPWRLDTRQEVDISLRDGDWTSLRLSGLNGLLTFVVALFAWAKALGSPSTSDNWLSVVNDLTLALS